MRLGYIIERAVWLFALGVLTLSCQREPDLGSGAKDGIPSLSIAIDFPRSEEVKSDAFLPAEPDENEIKTLQIWVFRHDDPHELVVSKTLDKDIDGFPEDGGVCWYKLDVSWKFVLEQPAVDVFVLANAASIGCTLKDDSDWEDVRNAKFGFESETKDPFGLSTPTVAVPDKGLPMSAMKLGLTLRGTGTQLKVDALQLTRAVSRIRMVFCKTQTALQTGQTPDELSVDEISIYPNQLPLKEYIFTENATGVFKDDTLAEDENYDARYYSRSGISSSDLKEHPTPESLVYVNQAPSSYKAMLDEAVRLGQVSDLGYVYLRESDIRLVGRINYTVNDKSRFREFSMKTDGDFARNHTWTLFAYFLSGRNLQLSLMVDDWDRSDYYVDFSDQSIIVTSRFVIDPNTAEVTEADDGYTNVKLIPGVPVKGHLQIVAPLGGTLLIYPQGAATLFDVSPEQITIKSDESEESGEESQSGLIEIEISSNNDIDINVDDLSMDEKTMTLSFFVETPAGRIINANSEVVDKKYRFIL